MQITFLRVAVVIMRLDRAHHYPKAQSEDAVYLHLLSAAQRHNVFEPFDPEAAELNHWLTSIQAGRSLCHDAWDLFMDEGTKRVGERAASV